MAVLSISWTSADRVAVAEAAVTPSEGDEEAPKVETPRADKPMLVYIEHPGDDEPNEKIAKITLDPDKIRVGCSYFKCIKMTAEAASQDRLLADTGKEYPRMVLITPDYEVVATLEGKISSSKLYAAMKKTASKSYKCNFDKNVKGVIKLLGEFDKIANERDVLKSKEEKGLKPAEAKKIAKEREELDDREKKAVEMRDELLKPELKTA
jgi:hypothetical protein